MAQKPITEYDGKRLIFQYWTRTGIPEYADPAINLAAQVHVTEKGTPYNFRKLAAEHPWLETTKLVLKPDQLVKRRGELGLVKLNLSWDQAQQYITENAHRELNVQGVVDELHTFILEPFSPHEGREEYYVSFQNHRDGTLVYFHHEGGVHVGDVDSKAVKYVVPIDQSLSAEQVQAHLLTKIGEKNLSATSVGVLAKFVSSLHKFYVEYELAFLEINPFVLLEKSNKIVVMDCAAKLDSAAHYLMNEKWGEDFHFPHAFGKSQFKEEDYVRELDEKTGASLKLTVLNVKGRIWTMVAGGGASVVYTDCIANYGGASELANYGEYSGNPNNYLTFEYAQCILKLLLRHPHPDGKLLIVGGGIANFTDVAETFKGIIQAFQQYARELRDSKVKILVRRGGPNAEQGLRAMGSLKQSHGLDIQVFGVDTTITAIVPLGMKALGLGNVQDAGDVEFDENHPALSYFQHGTESVQENAYNLFTKSTVSIVYGIQPVAVQGMLDFDFSCGRTKRSVCCMVYPFGENHFRKFYWGTGEILMPVYTSLEQACENHPDASVVVNFASFRSAYSSSVEAVNFPQIRTLAIIAEGVPEAQTRKLIKQCQQRRVRLIGPATVGGIKAGCFKVGNTGGVLENIISSKLYRPGSVSYVSKSGGMSNELNNIISRHSDGVHEGVAIGGDRYPGTTFVDHIMRYEANPGVKIIVLLGEVGGVDEYAVVELLRAGKIKKPLVAWCIGTCSDSFSFEVSFGHAGSNINGQMETSAAKNAALKAAGAFVPSDFDKLGHLVEKVFKSLVGKKTIQVFEEPPVPKIPMDFDWAAKLGLVRKPASFITSISDERGDEVVYHNVPMSKVLEQNMGVGGVIGLLWFQRQLPLWASDFIEMVLMVTADHGAAVSGAHNTIVTARAGKDLVSALCSGLLTIGPRFGGALDDTAKVFRDAVSRKLTPLQFVQEMHEKKELIPGIGHRVKSVQNPDSRVKILIAYARAHFKFELRMLEYALEVEKITTAKKNNLILNVDGCIACLFTDLVKHSGLFGTEEETTYLESGVLNGLFVLGRSIGFIGHFLDQTRLKQPLYRHPWSDITRLQPEESIKLSRSSSSGGANMKAK